MKTLSPIFVAVVFLGAVWSIYYSQFGGELSKDPGDWGTFGDYTGGIINPLLNFITIYLLIKSLTFQEKQVSAARLDAEEARNEAKVSRKNEILRSYESSLLVFAQIALDEFKEFSLKSPSGDTFKGGAAVSYLQEGLLNTQRSKEAFEKLVNIIDERNHEAIYSMVRSFAALFKLTIDLCPEEDRHRYVEMISLTIPTKAQYLLFMMEAYSSWRILEHPRALGFFEREASKETVENMRTLIKS